MVTCQGGWGYCWAHGKGEKVLAEFYVDLEALENAASGINTTLDAMATKKVSDIDAPAESFGHEGLASAISEFCDRWNIGVENLASDGSEVSDRLNRCVKRYQATEIATQIHLQRAAQDAGVSEPGGF